ncbi:MAG: hypothetical protein QN172_10220 [Armatimonadota bacterium]|nr:hypothetical protein [Armatimonadota bacterium]
MDAALHRAGLEALLGRGPEGPSRVDRVSFATMRQEGITEALTLDAHLAAQGFHCPPEAAATA